MSQQGSLFYKNEVILCQKLKVLMFPDGMERSTGKLLLITEWVLLSYELQKKVMLLIVHLSLIIKVVLRIKFLLEFINTAMLLLLLRLKMKQM